MLPEFIGELSDMVGAGPLQAMLPDLVRENLAFSASLADPRERQYYRRSLSAWPRFEVQTDTRSTRARRFPSPIQKKCSMPKAE